MSDTRQPTTVPPPFDPEDYARKSEAQLHTVPAPEPEGGSADLKITAKQIAAAPPLNKKVRIAGPQEDLEWFDLSDGARELLARIDGTKTLLELMEGLSAVDLVKAVAELHEAKLLAFDP